MRPNLFEQTVTLLKDPKRSVKERAFILLTLVTDFVALLALIGDIVIGESMVEIITLVIAVIVVPIITIVSVRMNRTHTAVRVIVVGVVVVLLPILFYFGGGIHGGGVIWIIFAFLYTGLVLGGRFRPAVLVFLTLETIVFYMDEYIQPDPIAPALEMKYRADTMISVILVGVVCCLVLWFLEWLFTEENKRAREEARKYEDLNKAQNRFFSSMSHEIRTPINSILGLNELILRQEDASDEIRRDAGNIQGAGRMLLSLVNDILDVSKIEAGKMDIIPVNYSIASLVSEIVNMMWLRSEQKGLELKIQIDPSIPRELFGDEVRIKQILVNLLNNAVKYTREGTVTLHIEKEDIRDDSVLLVYSVTDTGMGIKEDAIPYLFDAFQRADEESNRKIEGTGLGLSIVRQLATLMGGDVAVNSVYGQGSTFTVSLWQKVTNPSAVGDISITGYGNISEARKYVAGFTAPEARILIVDDNEMNLEVEKKLLEGTRVQVDTADSGESALSITTRMRYDLILMDHLMPQMDGIECLRRIRKQTAGLNNHAPVIALTANAGTENRELYRTSGFDGYLLKPVSGEQLEEMLLGHLPESKVTMTGTALENKSRLSTASGYSKKIPVLVTTNNLCDLPDHTLKELQIDILHFKLHVDGREYYDGVEAGTDEIIRYIKEGREFTSQPPTVEEFEHFFAKELKKAHQVIYITLASGISREYEYAREAAKNYGNVFVFNSGLNSSSMGLLVLIAYSMAVQSMTPGSIIKELLKVKNKVRCSFATSEPGVLLRRGLVKRSIYNIMKSIGLRCIFIIKNDIFAVDRIMMGGIEKCFMNYVDHALSRRYRPDTEVVFVTYADVPEEMLERIGERIKSQVPFKNIIFQKASGVVALSCGPGSFGILYLEEGDHPYNLEKLIVPYESEKDYQRYDNEEADEWDDYGEDGAESADDSNDGGSDNERAHGGASRSYDVSDSAAGAGRRDGAGVDNERARGGASGRYAVSGSTAGAGDEVWDSADYGAVSGDLSAAGEASVPKWYDLISGIDASLALENSGSEDALRSVMKIFYDSLEQKAEEIDGYYGAEDWENYTIKVHALKSSARLVGATALSTHAEAMEMAGKEKNVTYINLKHRALVDELLSFKQPLSEVFGEDERNALSENAGRAQHIDDGVYSEAKSGAAEGADEKHGFCVGELDDLLMKSMYEAIDKGIEEENESLLAGTFREMADYKLPDCCAATIEKLKEHFEKRDYTAMRKALNERH